MASGSDTTVAVPSTWIHSPKKPSESTHSETRGSRRTLPTLSAVSRLLTPTRPSASTLHAIGDSCGEPSRRRVAITAWWCSRMNALAWSSCITSVSRWRAAHAARQPLSHRSCHHRLEHVVGDVEVGIHVLHVVVVFEGVDHPQHRL